MKTLHVKLKKSIIKATERQQACVRGLGLKKIGQVRELQNSPEIRGMIKKVIHLVEVMEK